MPKNTEALEHELTAASSVEEYLQLNQDNLRSYTLAEYLSYLLTQKKRTKAQVIQRSGLEQHYAYHIFAGQKKASRIKVLAIALGFGLTPEETQYLLYYAKVERLYVRDSWDSVLWHALKHHLSVIETNLLLESLSESPLIQ